MSPLTLSLPIVPLIDFTLSNARRFYSSMGNPTGLKGLRWLKTVSTLSSNILIRMIGTTTLYHVIAMLWYHVKQKSIIAVTGPMVAVVYVTTGCDFDTFNLRTVPTIVIAHTLCASPDTRISYRRCLLIQGYFARFKTIRRK